MTMSELDKTSEIHSLEIITKEVTLKPNTGGTRLGRINLMKRTIFLVNRSNIQANLSFIHSFGDIRDYG